MQPPIPSTENRKTVTYHGYYGQHMYHPLVVFDGESGHLITALLRAGNTHASHSSVALLKRIVSRLRERWPEVEIELRADAGFAVPALYDYCEGEGITYTIALITNPKLREMAEELLEEARESHEKTSHKARLFGEDVYEAGSWEHERRVIYKAEAMEKGTNTRFVVTTRNDEPNALYEFYARRGEAENWIKDLCSPRESRSPELPPFRSQPVPLALARRGLLVDGCFEEEVDRTRLSPNATGHAAASSHQDRWQGKGADDEGPPASGFGPSGTKFMARPFGSLRRRS